MREELRCRFARAVQDGVIRLDADTHLHFIRANEPVAEKVLRVR